jgi:pimeloyl-ACP methyl ester carboxylesterase
VAEVAHDQISVNGIELHVAVAGPADGDPVVLCHGFPELWYSWRHQLGALGEAGYRVYAPDLRGYGASTAPADVAAYGSDHLTADLCGLLDHYGYETAVFSGHDWGSQVVWELGRLRPERVRAIYNMSVPFSQGSRPPTETFRALFGDRFFYMLYFQTIGPPEAEFDADPRRYVRSMLYAASGEGIAHYAPPVIHPPAEGTGFLDVLTPAPDVLPDWLSEHDVDVYAEGLSRHGLFGPVSFYRNLDANWTRAKDLPVSRYSMPTGFITGSLDTVNVMMPGGIERMAAVLPDFRGATVVDGAGHWVQQERPVETTTALVTFLASL